jgi:hypothetical protein
MKKRCTGVPVQANNMLECLRKEQANLPTRCVALTNNVETQCVFAKALSRVKAIFSGA